MSYRYIYSDSLNQVEIVGISRNERNSLAELQHRLPGYHLHDPSSANPDGSAVGFKTPPTKDLVGDDARHWWDGWLKGKPDFK